MAISKLEKSVWQPYFDRVSKAMDGKRAEVEVESLEIGVQIEAEWLPLIGITYDPKGDILDVAMEGLDHMIHKPRELYVEEEALELRSIEVIDEEEVRQIIKLRDPLMLPLPGSA